MGLGGPETSCKLLFPQYEASAKDDDQQDLRVWFKHVALCVNQAKLTDHMQANTSFLSFLDACVSRSKSGQVFFLSIYRAATARIHRISIEGLIYLHPVEPQH